MEEEPVSSEDSVENPLKPAKPLQNICISQSSKSSIESGEEVVEKVHETASFDKNGSDLTVKKTEEPKNKEKQKKLSSSSPVASSSPSSQNKEDTKCKEEVPAVNTKNHRIDRHQSDIFSLKIEPNVVSSIFSVNGAPSRKFIRQKKMSPNNVFPTEDPPSDKANSKSKADFTDSKDKAEKESYADLKRPSSSMRNPLTGTGLTSEDEYKFKTMKKKDGNPLLGVGYTAETAPSTHRIPPGGYSHKLW